MDGVRFCLILTLAVAVFFGRLDAGLLEPQEPRYAEVAREMTLAPSYVVPLLNHQPYLDKPPLFYWAILACYQVLGIHDWVARFVPAISGILTVLTIYFWGRSLWGPLSGFWGAIVLCLSARFVYLERILTFDGLLCFWVTLAFAMGERALRQSSWGQLDPLLPATVVDHQPKSRLANQGLHVGYLLGSALACGLGILTKGPVALALVIPPLLFLSRNFFVVGIHGLLSIMVAVPWFMLVMMKEPDFANYFFWRHNIVRFVTPFDHAEPWWFHFPGLLMGMCPWILLLPQVIRQRAVRFLLLTSGWTILFFSLAGSKRAVYILPALPPIALAIGHQIALWKGPSLLSVWGSSLVLILAVMIMAIAGWNQILPGPLVAIGITASLVGLGLVLRDAQPTWNKTAMITALIFVPAVQLLLPAYNQQFSLSKALLQKQRERRNQSLVILCYPQSWDSIPFYLPQATVHTFHAEMGREFLQAAEKYPDALLLIRSGRWIKILDDLPKNLRFESENRSGAIWAGRLVREDVDFKDDRGTHLVTQGDTPDRLKEPSDSNLPASQAWSAHPEQ